MKRLDNAIEEEIWNAKKNLAIRRRDVLFQSVQRELSVCQKDLEMIHKNTDNL